MPSSKTQVHPARLLIAIGGLLSPLITAQQPAEPVDITPIDGETYYIVNQQTGLQVDVQNAKPVRAPIVEQNRNYGLTQRWTFNRMPDGSWRITNAGNGFCFDSVGGLREPKHVGPRTRDAASHGGEVAPEVMQDACTGADSQRWALTSSGDGYYTISNKRSGLVIDLPAGGNAPETALVEAPPFSAETQSRQWLLRPAFFRGVDNALLEKQEAARVAAGVPWWNDAGKQEDVLQILKNHGVNMVRLRPSSSPPYKNVSQDKCAGNACYGETDAQDLDLAKRAKNLGMSVALTLLFDGGSSASVPPAWAGDTTLAQLQTDVAAYVKSEILAYKQANTMPDLVSIGNEVDTGFLGALGSPTADHFDGFAALQTAAIQAVHDAAADTSVGPAVPAPLTCIHVTPAWNLSNFFALADIFKIPYDVICQSYYPLFHGPLTAAQAAESNLANQPIEEQILSNAVRDISKPIVILETGEHYESGFQANDKWYDPPSPAAQEQFLLDLESVIEGLNNNLGMGMLYWDPMGVNIPDGKGGYLNGDDKPNAVYVWNGLTLFDNADTSGKTDASAPSYSELLPAIDALGGKLDPNLTYKLVNRGTGGLLAVYNGNGLRLETDTGIPAQNQEWRITSDDDGYFHIGSTLPGSLVIDDPGAATASGTVLVVAPVSSAPEIEWSIVSAADGYFRLINRPSGMALDMNGPHNQSGIAFLEPEDDSSLSQQWRIVPVP